tara:strand:- start:235 stop:780 length:546 start_codon:yes stop_codon:yes gene_type:complete
MKKLLVLLFSAMISFNSYGEKINSLFGMMLFDNAEKYVSSNYIDSNKYKNTETIEGFYNLIITDEIKAKSPFITKYAIFLDNDNIIHEIYGSNELMNLEICKAVQESLSSQLEEKYQVNFEYLEKPYTTFKIYSNYFYDSEGNYFSVQCRESYDDTASILQIYKNSYTYGEAVDEFYDSGL